LSSALAALTNEVARVSGLRVHRALSSDVEALSPEAELVVYRVVQEALTNAVRHGGARRAWVALRADGAVVELEVRDDGSGFDVAAVPEGAGLRGMRERAVLVGARLELESSPGSGTTVRLRFPV
jgi:two-component system sensor histidine kinase UhpB